MNLLHAILTPDMVSDSGSATEKKYRITFYKKICGKIRLEKFLQFLQKIIKLVFNSSLMPLELSI